MSQIDMSQYKKDARGNLVPIANIRPIDLLRDELVQKITARARAVQEELQEYRRWAMDEIAAFAELSANQYGTSLGGKKGNIRLHSFDGQYRVQLAMQDALVFDEGLAAAKVLIDECIREYSEGSRPELLAIINAAFATDRNTATPRLPTAQPKSASTTAFPLPCAMVACAPKPCRCPPISGI